MVITTHRQGDFRGLHLGNGVERIGRGTYRLFLVSLLCHNTDMVRIGRCRDYLAARRVAEEAAKFLGLPVVDETGDTLVVQPAGEVGQTLRQRLGRTGRGGGRLVFRVPRQLFHRLVAMPVGAGGLTGLLFAGIFLAVMLCNGKSDDPEQLARSCALVGGVVWAASGALLVLVGLGHSLTATVVEAGPDGLDVRSRWLCFRSHQHIPGDELKEVKLDAGGLLAVSDREAFSFGQELSAGEREVLRRAIEEAVAGPARSPDEALMSPESPA